MLNNHKRPPGPENRGERSRMEYDKRPAHEIALDIDDKASFELTDHVNESKMSELKSLLFK